MHRMSEVRNGSSRRAARLSPKIRDERPTTDGSGPLHSAGEAGNLCRELVVAFQADFVVSPGHRGDERVNNRQGGSHIVLTPHPVDLRVPGPGVRRWKMKKWSTMIRWQGTGGMLGPPRNRLPMPAFRLSGMGPNKRPLSGQRMRSVSLRFHLILSARRLTGATSLGARTFDDFENVRSRSQG